MIFLLVICAVTFISNIDCQQPIYHRITPKHGRINSSMNSFTCPSNGAVTGINYYTDQFIRQMEFVCSSSEGVRSFGPYGIPQGRKDTVSCSDNKYISSFHGTSGEYLSHLGIRCRKVNADLKGEGSIQFSALHGKEKTGATFDDLAYSNGARPVGVTIWTSNRVDAIQMDYSNSPVKLCTDDCSVYKEESAPLRGKAEGLLTVLSCPDQGVITAITFQFDDDRVISIQPTCTSGLGTVVLDRVGPNQGRSITVRCPPGTIIGSLHGKHTTYIRALGIRCVKFNETGDVPRYDQQGSTEGVEFDDKEFSEKGYRPVQIRLYHDNDINGMQVKYGNLPVSTNCKVNRIEITDETVEAKSDGFEVIGVSSATTCESGERVLKLDYSREVTEEVGIEISDGGDVNWATELSISATSGVSLFGAKAEVTVGLAQSTGGSKSWSTANSNSSSTSTGASAGTDVNYDAPGACIIIGYVDRYTINRENVAVKYHYTCQIGELEPKLATIKVQSKSYGNAYFDDFQFKYDSKEKCARESKDCVKSLNANTILADTVAFEKAFYNCFPSDSGKPGKRECKKH